MDVQSEKKRIIDRLEKIEDESLILTVKNLLDFALGKSEQDQLLIECLNRGIQQSKAGETRPNKIVMAEIKAKYG
ncbi:MAG: hypothetical protein AAGC88_08550 [Bacteroidota bacterium]